MHKLLDELGPMVDNQLYWSAEFWDNSWIELCVVDRALLLQSIGTMHFISALARSIIPQITHCFQLNDYDTNKSFIIIIIIIRMQIMKSVRTNSI